MQQRLWAVALVMSLILLACFTWLGEHRPAIAPVFLIVSSTTSAALLIALFLFVARAQRLGQRASARLESYFMDSLEVQGLTGPDGRFKRVNPAFTELLGYSDDELLRQPFMLFVHRDDQATTLAEMEKVMRGAPSRAFLNRWLCKDGSYKWLEWNARQFTKDLYHASGRDVTDRKEAEVRLAFGADHSVPPTRSCSASTPNLKKPGARRSSPTARSQSSWRQ